MNQLVPLSDWMAVVSSHGSETTPLFNTQLITSHCLLQPKGEVSLSPTPTPPCSAPSHSPTPAQASSTGIQIFLQADLAHTGPKKPFLLLPIQRDDLTPRVLQVRSGKEWECEVKREGSLSLLGTNDVSSASLNHSFTLTEGQVQHTV